MGYVDAQNFLRRPIKNAHYFILKTLDLNFFEFVLQNLRAQPREGDNREEAEDAGRDEVSFASLFMRSLYMYIYVYKA